MGAAILNIKRGVQQHFLVFAVTCSSMLNVQINTVRYFHSLDIFRVLILQTGLTPVHITGDVMKRKN